MKSKLLVTAFREGSNCRRRSILQAGLALSLALSGILLRTAVADPTLVPASVGGVIPNPNPNPLPVGNRITALSKDAVGETGQAPAITRTCQGEITEEIDRLYFRMKLSPGPCDEGFSREVLNGYLVGTVDILRRKPDLRGCFTGQWQIVSPSGAALAAGTMDGTVGCGTHRPPATPPFEPCSDPRHYEARLTGRVLLAGPYQGAQICATLAGSGPLQPSTPQLMSIEGVVISQCVQ